MSWTTTTTTKKNLLKPRKRTTSRRKPGGRLAGSIAAALVLIWQPSQAAQFPDDDPALSTIVTRALESPDLPALAAGLIDSVGGRLSGTPAGAAAEGWAARWLREFGYDSVWYEIVQMPVWRRGELRITVSSPSYLRGRRIAALAFGYSPAIDADSVPIVDIGRGDLEALAAAGRRARGAALLTDVVGPGLIAAAAEAGAAAVLHVGIEPGRLPRARTAPSASAPAPVALIGLSREDGLWLRRQGGAGLLLRLSDNSVTAPGAAANVVAEIGGTDPQHADEVVVLGGHLDAWDVGDGALDNGTGVLAVMAAARALAAESARPRRTIRVVLFAGEELGLLGSRAYVAAHRGELPGITAMLNMDMVGEAEGFGATGHPEADTLFKRVVVTPILHALHLSSEVDHGGGPGSDHQPFLLAGVPTVYVRTSLSEDAVRWYHNAGDTLDKIDLDAVRSSAGAAAALVWVLADHPGRPLRHLTAEETRALVERLGWVK